MKRKIKALVLLYLLLKFIAIFVIDSLIMWGAGSLATTVFDINYNWTFMHGVVMAVICEIIDSTLKK